jgi:hypothetical protein
VSHLPVRWSIEAAPVLQSMHMHKVIVPSFSEATVSEVLMATVSVP